MSVEPHVHTQIIRIPSNNRFEARENLHFPALGLQSSEPRLITTRTREVAGVPVWVRRHRPFRGLLHRPHRKLRATCRRCFSIARSNSTSMSQSSTWLAQLDRIVTNPAYHDVLAILKGARNGFVYGVRVRAPHALIMTLIFHGNKK